jgi:hypothetical protein
MFPIFLLLLAACAKILLVLPVAILLRRTCTGQLESVLAAWLVVQTATIGVMLALSVISELTPNVFRSMVLLSLLLLSLAMYLHDIRFRSFTAMRFLPSINPASIFALISMFCCFAAVFVHGVYFYDTTDDALYYGLSRIAYWYQHHSLLAFDQTDAVHLFAFEWNGELNGLFYFLLTGSDRSISLGNLEFLIVLALALIFLLKSFSVDGTSSLAIAFLFLLVPASFVLSMTVKGDLAAELGSLLGLAWTIRSLSQEKQRAASLWSITAFSWAAGAKITALPLCFPLILLHSVMLLRARVGVTFWATAAGFVGLNLARKLINVLQFGSLLSDLSASERPVLTVDHFLTNARGLLSSLFYRGVEPNQYFALFHDFGFIGIISVAMAIAALAQAQAWPIPFARNNALRSAIVLVIFFGSLIFVMAGLPWFTWSSRYFLPWVIPALLIPFTVVFAGPDASAGSRREMAQVGLVLLGLLHFYVVFRPSEITPGISLRAAFSRALVSTDMERKLAARASNIEIFSKYLTPANGRRPLRILVLTGPGTILFPLWGNNAHNTVEFAASDELLKQAMAKRLYDLVVAWSKLPLADFQQEPNYECTKENDAIFCRLRALQP